MATKVEPDRDQYGRYKLPDPETGELKSWTRATTVASTLGDTYALEKWKMRQVALGVAANASLRAKLAGNPSKGAVDAVCQEAMDRVGSSDKADIGTALHAMTEEIDLGNKVVGDFPPEFQGDLKAYVDGMKANAIHTQAEWVERIVINPVIGAAGTLDRIVELEGKFYIADLKTGGLDYALMDISIQLAIYANSVGAWTGADYEALPPISMENALVLHLPAGKGEFSLWGIDIVRGWELAQLSRDVRLIQKEKPGFKIS